MSNTADQGHRLRGEQRINDAGSADGKAAGFDPAAAPMATDAEAGGTATVPDMSALPVEVSVKPGFNATSHASAMRSFDDEPKPRGLRVWPMLLLALVAAAAAALIAVSLFGQ